MGLRKIGRSNDRVWGYESWLGPRWWWGWWGKGRSEEVERGGFEKYETDGVEGMDWIGIGSWRGR